MKRTYRKILSYIEKNRIELILLTLLFIFSFYIRFINLGYSHFYGDETKTIYWNKSVEAQTFLFDQRKGPVQFISVWFMEKISLGYNEGILRLPFAFAGFVSIFIFYLLVRKKWNKNIALISSYIFAFSGFNIAFSRTIQYQTFLIMFGLLGMFLFEIFLESKNKLYLFLSSVSLSLSLLSHYDGIFFLLPVIYEIFLYLKKYKDNYKNNDNDNNNNNNNKIDFLKHIYIILLYFALPIIILLGLFYIPYVFRGYMQSNTIGYLLKRVSGKDYKPNNSIHTYLVYNPIYISIIIPIIGLIKLIFGKFSEKVNVLKNKHNKFINNNYNYNYKYLLIWFFIAFVLFEMVFSNPGTHIHNYLIPIYISFGIFISEYLEDFSELLNKCKNKSYEIYPRYTGTILISFLVTFQVIISFYVYDPNLNKGYPWKQDKIFGIKLVKPNPNYQLFLYGYPYNRGWDQIRKYFLENKSSVKGVFTNDNDTVAKFYLREYLYTIPGNNFIPQYFIDVKDNQEASQVDKKFMKYLDINYSKEKEIFVEDKLVAIIYKRNF